MGAPLYRDRFHAGQALAEGLRHYEGRADVDVVVLALPRGGVPVGFAVARALRAPLDVFVVRKLGVPGHEELAMGAISSGGVRVLNAEIVHALGIPPAVLTAATDRERAELERRERLYRGDRPAAPLAGRVAILVDDGLATGASMRAAAAALRLHAPSRIVVAVPVAAPEACAAFRTDVDEIVCASAPEPFYAVGYWYADFAQTTDEEVRDLLRRPTRDAMRAA